MTDNVIISPFDSVSITQETAADGIVATGTTGPIGPQGPTGPTGPAGPSTARLAGFSGNIIEGHSSNAVTFSVKTEAGADPTAGAPVRFTFLNDTGGWDDIDVVTALSITVPSGATLGTVNGVGCRIWIAAFNDAGTVRLAVRNNVSGRQFSSPPEGVPNSSTLTPSTAWDTFYTTGSAVTSKPWIWLATARYESGLVTAGLWAVSPTAIRLVSVSMPRTGQVLKSYVAAAAAATLNTVTPTAVATQNITLLSAANLVRFSVPSGHLYIRSTTASGLTASIDIRRGGTSCLNSVPFQYGGLSAIEQASPVSFAPVVDAATASRVTTIQTYAVYIWVDSAAQNGVSYAVNGLIIEELMG